MFVFIRYVINLHYTLYHTEVFIYDENNINYNIIMGLLWALDEMLNI